MSGNWLIKGTTVPPMDLLCNLMAFSYYTVLFSVKNCHNNKSVRPEGPMR